MSLYSSGLRGQTATLLFVGSNPTDDFNKTKGDEICFVLQPQAFLVKEFICINKIKLFCLTQENKLQI